MILLEIIGSSIKKLVVSLLYSNFVPLLLYKLVQQSWIAARVMNPCILDAGVNFYVFKEKVAQSSMPQENDTSRDLMEHP